MVSHVKIFITTSIGLGCACNFEKYYMHLFCLDNRYDTLTILNVIERVERV